MIHLFWLIISIACLVGFFVYLVETEKDKKQSLTLSELLVAILIASLVSCFFWLTVWDVIIWSWL